MFEPLLQGFEARVLRSPATDRAAEDKTRRRGGSGLVTEGTFLVLRTEADVRALVAAAAACACPAYLWLATDPTRAAVGSEVGRCSLNR